MPHPYIIYIWVWTLGGGLHAQKLAQVQSKTQNNYACCIVLCETFQMMYDTWLYELYDIFDILQYSTKEIEKNLYHRRYTSGLRG